MKQRVIKDSLLSLIASALPLAVLQLVVLPLLAARMGDSRYGLTITLISVSTVFSVPWGNSLNNIRLLHGGRYERRQLEGDFNVMLRAGVLLGTALIALATIYYEGGFHPVSMVLIMAFSALNLIREYLAVEFRIRIDYVKYLWNNVFLTLGYFAGLGLFIVTGYWQFIFLAGALFSLLHLLRHTTLHREAYRRTSLFPETAWSFLSLYASAFIAMLPAYADKLMIYPLVGASAVSVYYSAGLLGKLVPMVISPVSGVMLSHLARAKTFHIRQLMQLLAAALAAGAVGFVFILLIDGPVLGLLYPDWAAASLRLVPLTSAASITFAICSMVNPLILRFTDMKWQLIIELVYIGPYIGLSLGLFHLWGLSGFALGVFLSAIFKLSFMSAILIWSYYRGRILA